MTCHVSTLPLVLVCPPALKDKAWHLSDHQEHATEQALLITSDTAVCALRWPECRPSTAEFAALGMLVKYVIFFYSFVIIDFIFFDIVDYEIFVLGYNAYRVIFLKH